MAYYVVPDVEDPDRDIDGPYRNKDEVIDALSLIANSAVFESKREALNYFEDF